MPGRDIIVVGASAGGVEALVNLVRGLSADVPAAVFVVLHLPSNGFSMLPQILDRAGPLPAAHAVDGEPIRHGQIYVAPPDHHLLVTRETVRVLHGSKENGSRPAVNPLFRTAASAYRRRVIGVILSGLLDDGAAGLRAIKRHGGVAIVQDPEDALFTGMPRSALEMVDVDHCLPARDIGALLSELAHTQVEEVESTVSGGFEDESEVAELERAGVGEDGHPGIPSIFTCPECHGTLWELHDGKLVRYRCRVGHAFSADSLLSEQDAALEAALWMALRALEEQASLARRLVARARANGLLNAVARFEAQARDADERAAIVREVLLQKSTTAALQPMSAPADAGS